jgi:uncharacterized protein YabN with tetrapyrrole methylase and pyrophosphatase domain
MDTSHSSPLPKPDLNIIGLGVKIPDQITAEARDAMARCSRIFAIVQEPPLEWLPTGTSEPISVTNVLGLYAEGALRTQNYDRVADIIFQSLRDTKSVGYVTYGNPLAYDSVAQNLVRYARQAEIPVRVVPGISSVDTLLCDLGLDMAPGIQVYEASWLVAARIRLEVTVAAIVLQVGSFGSLRTNYRVRPEAASLNLLAEYLTQFYPKSHELSLVRSSGAAQQSPHIKKTLLADLCTVHSEDLLNSSLYVPPLGAARLDERFLSAIERV